MMMKSEQGYMTPLSTSMELEDALAAPIGHDTKLSLTQLWEYVIRAQTLPESLDLDVFFETIHERLRDAEWEVRQHALRVLVDFIPLIPNNVLDAKISSILSDLVANLGHLGPAVRKGAVDCLRAYVNHTEKTNEVITDLVARGIENAQENKVQTNVVLGIILSLPFLLNNKLTDATITYVIHKLLDKIAKVIHQETVLRALLRIREIIGYDKFNDALATHDSYNSKQEFDLLCEVYDLHTFRSTSRPSFKQATFGSSFDSANEKKPILKLYNSQDSFGDSDSNSRFIHENIQSSEKSYQSSENSSVQNSDDYLSRDCNQNVAASPYRQIHSVSGSGTVKTILKPYPLPLKQDVKTFVKTEDVLEDVSNIDLEKDRVILETEIQLESGPAITMKIHEEGGNNDDRNRTFKVLPDSDGEDYEHLRRTPRRVRFGGEIVKLRTPDSDSNMHSDDNEATISIISGENGDKPVIEIKYIENETKTTTTTTRSLIPIPVKQTQSEPNSPIRPNLHRSKLYKSSPNLSRSRKVENKILGKSRIPKRYNTEVKKSVETKIQIKISENPKRDDKAKLKKDSKDDANLKIRIKETDKAKIKEDKRRSTEDNSDNRSRITKNQPRESRSRSSEAQQNTKNKAVEVKYRDKYKTSARGSDNVDVKRRISESSLQAKIDEIDGKIKKLNDTKVGLLDKPKDNNKPKLKSPMPKKDEVYYNPLRRNSREDEFSPIPIHNEIEVLHNLTRSPSPITKAFSFSKPVSRSGSLQESSSFQPFSGLQQQELQKNQFQQNQQVQNDRVSFNKGPGLQKTQQTLDKSSLQERYNETMRVKTNENYTGENRRYSIAEGMRVYSSRPKDEDKKLPDIAVSQKISERNNQNQNYQIIPLPPPQAQSALYKTTQKPGSSKKFDQNDNTQILRKPDGLSESSSFQSSKSEAGGDFLSFQVYNSSLSDSFYEFADSPIPTKDSGECLTCSSSGSDTVILEKRKMDQFSVLDERIIEDLQNMEDVRARQRGLEELLRVIQNPNIMAALQGRLPSLLYILFMAEQQPILQPIAEQTLSILFTSMNQQSLVSRLQQISLNLSKMGSPLGVRLAILLMRRIQPGLLVDQLLSDAILGAKSSKVREGALQILMTVSRIFPSTELNVPKCSKSVINILRDKKRRVRQAALETLAALAQLSSPMAVLETANDITADWNDREQILRVIRTRLSRKQLPTVNMNGSIRYSTPTGESEIEWLSRGSGTISPQPPNKSARRFSARSPQDTNNNDQSEAEEKRKRFYSAHTESMNTSKSSAENLSENINGFVVLEKTSKSFLEESKDLSESFSSEYQDTKEADEPNILMITYEDSQDKVEEKPAVLMIQDTQDSSFNVSQEQTPSEHNVLSSDGNQLLKEETKNELVVDSVDAAEIESPRRFVPDSEEIIDERFVIKNRFNTAEVKVESAKPTVDFGRRYSSMDGASDQRTEIYAVGIGQKVNYWKNNPRRQMTLGDDEEGNASDWSRISGEEPAGRAPTTQIWAIDPSAFGASEKLSTANGTLRQIYLVKGNESKTAATNTPPQDYREGATNTTPYHRNPPTRGRSFSPPTRSNKQSDYDSCEELDTRRFVKTSYKREVQRIRREERVRKAFSSEHLSNVERLRKDEVVSSGSSSGSSVRQSGNWRDLRSGIPVPIQPDTKLRFKNRNNYKQERKGPLTIPYYPPVKSPSPHTTPEKFTNTEEVIGRQPFSSGSESSGYFTPPPEQSPQEITPHASPQLEHRTPTANPERFIQIETPKRSVENFRVVDSEPETLVDDEEEEEEEERLEIETIDEVTPKFQRKSTSNSLDDFSLREDHSTTEPVLSKSATNSLDEADFTQITYSQKNILSKSEYDIKISTHITRKNVSSAPSLNDFQSFETTEDNPPPKTSLPGSVVDSLEDTEAPEELYLSPQKMPVKKIIPKSSVRRKSSRVTNGGVNVYPDTLRPYAKPKEAFHEVVEQLESTEWEITMKGLQGMVRLIRHHKELVENHMHTVCVLLGKQIRNLRSQVARAACLAASELFGQGKRSLEMEVDELAGPLLHRTADTNKFLRSDANAALDEMSANLSVPKVVSVVTYRGCGHQNAVVRCASARLLANIVHRLGAEKVFQLPRDTRDKILVAGANMLSEGSLETRKHAKLLLGNLINHSQFHRALSEAVPASVLRHIDKTLRSLVK